MAYRAFIQPQFSTQGVKLLIAEEFGFRGLVRTLRADGVWREAADGIKADDEGVTLPFEALEAVEEAIALYRGKSSHAATEAAVLRESLAVERKRVDAILSRAEVSNE